MSERGERVLSLPGWQIHVRAPDTLSAPLAAVLSTVDAGEALPPLALTVSEETHLASGTVEGRALWSVTLPPRGWLSLLTGQIGATAAALFRRQLFVHAGAVALGGRGWIIIGESGAGKTSTTGILLRLGASYLTDEIAVLDPAARTVRPFALPMGVKPWTARALGDLPPGSEVAREGEVQFFLPQARAAEPVPLEGFVLLQADGRRGLAPLRRAEMLLALPQHHSSLRYAHRLEDAFAGFSDLLRAARCYSLAAATPAEAAGLIAAAASQG